jgi:hypothetical protein
MHIDCDSHYSASLRVTAEDRMGCILCYHSVVGAVHATRGRVTARCACVYIYVCVFVYVCLCVCVCLCVLS